MTFSMQSRHELRAMAEASYGQIPAAPGYTFLRHSGCDLALRRSSIESDEIRSDRQISNFFHGTEHVSGEIDFELSFGSYDDLLGAVLMSSWAGDELVTGNTITSFALERSFSDVGKYQLFSGCCIDRLDLSIQPESLVTGRFHVAGKTVTYADVSAEVGATSPEQNAPMEAFMGSIDEAGTPLGIVTGLDLKIENGLEGNPVLGSRNPVSAGFGKSRISGDLTVYFQDQSLHQKFLDQSHSSLSLTLTGEGGAYEITLPRILYMSAEDPVRADRAVSSNFRFVALADAVTGTDIKIVRSAA
jgi:hypothetical protein